MKIYLIPVIAFLLSSCSVKTIYHVVKTKSDQLNNDYVFENDDIKCSYDFWNFGSPYSFKLYNKTDKAIFLDWSKSSFIVNGATSDYYKETTITESKSIVKTSANIFKNNSNATALTSGIAYSATQSYKQKKSQYIPANSFGVYSLNSSMIGRINGCDYKLKGLEKIKEFNFQKNNSPYNFRNHLTYSFTENGENAKVIDNEFWVNQLYIMNEKTFLGDEKQLETCDKKLIITNSYIYSYPYKDKGSFYFTEIEQKKSLGAVIGILGGLLVILVIAVAI